MKEDEIIALSNYDPSTTLEHESPSSFTRSLPHLFPFIFPTLDPSLPISIVAVGLEKKPIIEFPCLKLGDEGTGDWQDGILVDECNFEQKPR